MRSGALVEAIRPALGISVASHLAVHALTTVLSLHLVALGAPVDTGQTSATRYYLSLNGTKDATDRLLTGSRAVPILGPASERVGLASETVRRSSAQASRT